MVSHVAAGINPFLPASYMVEHGNVGRPTAAAKSGGSVTIASGLLMVAASSPSQM